MCAVGQQPTALPLPGVPFIEPVMSATYSTPAIMAVVQGGLAATSPLYSANLLSGQEQEVLFLGLATAHVQSPNAPFIINAVEPRPHGGLVWGMGYTTTRARLCASS